MKAWKRNAVIVTVLVFVCVAVYLNWSAGKNDAGAADAAMDAQMEQAVSAGGDEAVDAGEQPLAVNAEYFAEARLSRQESRDAALSLLTQASAMEGEEASAAGRMEELADWTLRESQIETLVMAKGFADCVATLGESGVSVMVPAAAEGLSAEQVAQISDIAAAETGCTMEELVIIEVK